METKRIPAEQGNKLIAFHWELNCNDYRNQVSFTWRYISVSIEIRSFCHPPGKDKQVHFTFFVNERRYHFHVSYNCYGGSHSGELPEIRDDYYKLSINAGPQYLEIREVQTRKYERPDLPLNPEQKDPIDDRYESLGEKSKKFWFAISNEKKIIPRDNPVKGSQYNMWIRKSLHHQFPGVAMYKYQLYDSNLIPIIPVKGNFSCVSIIDDLRSGGLNPCITTSCEISDKECNCRTFSLGPSGINTVMKALRLLATMQLYQDWNDFDQMQDVWRTGRLEPGIIDKSLDRELRRLGLKKSK